PSREELGLLFDVDIRGVIDDLSEVIGGKNASDRVISLMSHSRVKKHYTELLKLIARDGAKLRVRTRSNPFGISLDSKRARDRITWLELESTKEETITTTGILVGGNIEKDRFDITSGDVHYSGRTSEQARTQMKNITFGAEVEAQMLAVTSDHEEGITEPDVSYLLKDIRLRTTDSSQPA
ncbi:MAG: hypothetical protein HQK56_20120, partial [Deltaproteobacteria bacterium]|nr:hypothetical protein [Deltaproteobacteria bacterium]